MKTTLHIPSEPGKILRALINHSQQDLECATKCK